MSTVPFDVTGALSGRPLPVDRRCPPARAGPAGAAEGAALRPGRNADRQHADAGRPGDRGDRGALRNAARSWRASCTWPPAACRSSSSWRRSSRRTRATPTRRRSSRRRKPAPLRRHPDGGRDPPRAAGDARPRRPHRRVVEQRHRERRHLRARRRVRVRPGARLRRRSGQGPPAPGRDVARVRRLAARRCCSSAIRCTTARSPSAKGSRSSAWRRRSRPSASRCASRPVPVIRRFAALPALFT